MSYRDQVHKEAIERFTAENAKLLSERDRFRTALHNLVYADCDEVYLTTREAREEAEQLLKELP